MQNNDYVIAGVVIVFVLAVGLLLVAELELVRRVNSLERMSNETIKTLTMTINRVEENMELTSAEIEENRESIRQLDSHVDYFLTGKWK